MKNVFRAMLDSLRGAVRGLFASAEDPRKTSAFAYQHQHELLLNVRQALADLAVAKDRLKEKVADAQAKLPQLQQQAQEALAAGNEEVARLALHRRQIAVTRLQALVEQVTQTEQEGHRLTLVEQRLSAQIEAHFARQELIAARHSAVQAQTGINASILAVSSELSGLETDLARAESRTAQMQAQASAIDRYIDTDLLASFDQPADPSEKDQYTQDSVDQDVEQQLQNLKKRLKP